ncbi:Myb-like DNA-binding domain containing protein [Histomonas meleagridis]|uniref:Myb-like DNA-binding domain containing protein n=1 Tax=Histomonas meleagridis TaxID=135588 RepID=UPI00355A2075|nr:Myb-like DNA-binding domain containing protein [Histomonas meleagridis]KAH0799851.1 Myb-like DNA-binding domain containing protein [Histomonas meleagridis]
MNFSQPIPQPIFLNSNENTNRNLPVDQNNSPWLIPNKPSTPLQHPIVRRIHPMRPVSTFVHTPGTQKMKPVAAPFPTLPSNKEIQEQKANVEQEIKFAQAELLSLQHQRDFYDNSSKRLIPTTTINGIREYHNLILCDSVIDGVISENKEKKIESEKLTLINTQDTSKYSQIMDIPTYRQKTREYYDLVTPLFFVQMLNKEIIEEKKQSLAQIYVEIQKNWLRGSKAIDEYSTRVDDCHENWPPEFPKGRTKSNNLEEVMKYTAPDQPQFMTMVRKRTNCFYNTNGFVEDPEAAHNEFKNRISWSEEEKEKFVTKYMQHPKKFHIIAKHLPLKCVKDVIEFYYVSRYTLSLKEKEGVYRKRGGRRKIVSEGTTRTNRY